MTSSPPLIFKRTKSKPASRVRQTSPENEASWNLRTTPDDVPSVLAVKLKNKVKRAVPKSRLSFGGGDDDDEGSGEDVFRVKKSSLSRKMALGKHPANVSLNLDQATISPNRGPTYDQAYLKELKDSTPSSRPAAVVDPYDADMSMDTEDISIISVGDPDTFATGEAIIPSEASVKVAKDHRERLRKTGTSGEEDFISLSVVRRSDEYQGPHPGSRLVREEDELGEGDDEFAEYTSAQERIALGKKSRKLEAKKRRDAMKEMFADAEEDEEAAEWEQEQLRRGHSTPDSRVSTTSKIKEIYKPAPIPTETPIPILSSAIARLTEQLTELTTSHASNMVALGALARERADVDNRVSEMRELVGKAEEKRAWFDNFKDWLESVASFLDEKYPVLENLEETYVSLLQERREMISNRRCADDEDDLSAILGPLPASPPTESAVEEAGELSLVTPKPHPAALRRERREARIKRRQRRHQHQRTSREDGYSTDSSLPPGDAVAYSSAVQSVMTQRKTILSDVKAEEFLDPAKGRWSVWRDKYSESYFGAYGGLGVVSVWEFWVRLEMVGWDFIENPKSLDSFSWYQGLYNYSRSGDQDDELGPDGDLVSSMISKAVIPRLLAIINGGAVDPYSEDDIWRLVHLTEEVEASVEGLEDAQLKFRSFLQSIMAIFHTAVNDTESLLAKFQTVHRGAPPFDPESIPARKRFLARRIKLLGNILRWRKYVKERSNSNSLVKRLVENCFLGIAQSGWEVGGEELSRKMVEILPNELVPYELKRRLEAR